MIGDLDSDQLFAKYQDLQRYVHWTEEDAARIEAAAPLVSPHFADLIDDFYEEVSRHPNAHKTITGGAEQIKRLKSTLHSWLEQLFSVRYDKHYVTRRWRVGFRHIDIGLNQVYTNVALSRMRTGMLTALESAWQGSMKELLATRLSLIKLLDLDLAIIEDAYQTAYFERQQRAERLIAVGQMAGGVAHELRNPLNVVKTSVYYLLNAKDPPPEKKIEHLQRIERQVGLADKVITALSDFAKLPFPEVRPVQVAALVQEAVESSGLPDTVQATIRIPPDLPAILADPVQVSIVLTNLIRNARDAMPAGGKLLIAATSADGFVEITIHDTGHGIPRDVLMRIMEPLFSTKARGLGLGLAIARAIVDKHRGQLSVKSEEGKGSEFTIKLPVANDDVNA